MSVKRDLECVSEINLCIGGKLLSKGLNLGGEIIPGEAILLNYKRD